MLRNTLFLVCLVVASFQLSAREASEGGSNWWERTPWKEADRGFNWYPDPGELDPIEKKEAEKPKPKTIYEMTTLEEIKKELDRLKGDAVVNPTEERVLAFLRAQNWVMDKSSLFADLSRRVVWKNPDVNYAARSPSANFALQNERGRQAVARKEALAELAQTHGLLYFSRADCNFCKDQAPVLKGFSLSSGMQVLAISLDGGPVSMFPDAKPDNGISMVVTGGYGITTVPALFLINRRTRETIPIATGVISGDEIAERIRVLVTTKPGQEF